MFTSVHWISTGCDLRLAIAARPRSGDWLEDEIANWASMGVGRVVSLLEQHEIAELGLEGEPGFCAKSGLEFRSFPIPDRGVPSDRMAAIELAGDIARDDCATVIHCRAGIGRSSLMAAAVLAALGVQPAKALDEISRARELRVPDTDAQTEWVMGLGEA